MTQRKKHQPHKIHNCEGGDIIIGAGFGFCWTPMLSAVPIKLASFLSLSDCVTDQNASCSVELTLQSMHSTLHSLWLNLPAHSPAFEQCFNACCCFFVCFMHVSLFVNFPLQSICRSSISFIYPEYSFSWIVHFYMSLLLISYVPKLCSIRNMLVFK